MNRVVDPVLPESENLVFFALFSKPEIRVIFTRKPGLYQVKNGRFQANLSHKMAQIVQKDLKPFVIFNPNKSNNVIIITLENY